MSNFKAKTEFSAVHVQAAAWVVRLHGPNRSPEVEAGLKRWLAEHTDHQHAFELATDTWNAAEGITPADRSLRLMRTRSRLTIPLTAAAGAATVAILLGLWTWLRVPELQTRVGEQRTLRLADGTQLSLNTDTEVSVHFDAEVRRVTLKHGEALFDVTQEPARPFIVTAGNRTIEALGTTFVVRHDDRQLAVTLVEGKVAVSSASDGSLGKENSSEAGYEPKTRDRVVTLAPGQRLSIDTSAGDVLIDQPNLEKATAWRRGLVMLDDTPLGKAISEMNRYSTVKLMIEQPQVAALQVSGIFRAGDSMRFARAVAKTYQLTVIEQSDRIVLAGAGVN